MQIAVWNFFEQFLFVILRGEGDGKQEKSQKIQKKFIIEPKLSCLGIVVLARSQKISKNDLKIK